MKVIVLSPIQIKIVISLPVQLKIAVFPSITTAQLPPVIDGGIL